MGVVLGSLVEQACSSSSSPTTTRPTPDASWQSDGASNSFVPGDGGPCLGPVGGYPPATCDPSDEQAQGCLTPFDAGCDISPKCGDVTTCEPFTTNPAPDAGVGTFRMRLLNLTAPPTLATQTVQQLIVTQAVDLPSASSGGGAQCGEDGTGLFSWLMSINKSAGTVLTGGAPPTADPFDTGYCFMKGNVGTVPIAPITVQAKFTGNTFDSVPVTNTLNIPIFQPGDGGVIILPIVDAAFHDVTVSSDGNCIGAININASYPQGNGGLCIDPQPMGESSCSRWHSSGTLGGYITLKEADTVQVAALQETLCVLLIGDGASNGKTPAACSQDAFTMGDYNSSTHQQCNGGDGCDSVWISGQFAASAVKVNDGTGVPLCNGGTAPPSG
jgi:hypothetical protein